MYNQRIAIGSAREGVRAYAIEPRFDVSDVALRWNAGTLGFGCIARAV